MIKIIYNPLSKNGQGMDVLKKVVEHFKELNKEVSIINALDVDNPKHFIETFGDDDEVIILGGDGTLHHLANKITDYLREDKIKNKIFLYKGGTGNDFLNDVKKELKDNLIYLNDHLRSLPTVEFNGKEKYFVNGVGLGLDALIAKKVNESSDKSKGAYLKNVFKSLKEYKKSAATIIVDGKEYKYSKVLLATIMHGRYLGGGLKLAPSQKRDGEYLTLAVANKIPTWLLVFILPTLFFGGHIIFPGVHMFKGKNIEIIFEEDKYLQLDGEIEPNIRNIKAYKKSL